jgi:MarR family
MAEWQLLSNHGRVLLLVAREPTARLRDIAAAVGITERSAHRIITELVEDGYVIRRRNGSRNEYEVRPDVAIHDPVLGERWVGEILAAVADSDGGAARPRRRSRAAAGQRRGRRAR